MIAILLLLLSVVLIILMTAKFNVHPFLALLGAALFFGLFSDMSLQMVIQSINDGFGGTLGKIGIVIVLGVIIGAFLEHSGGAFKLAEIILKIIGRKRVHAAMGIVGFIVSIPVFADSGFIILNPLNKSLTKRAKLSIVGTATALILGLMISHVLVPPTPGPIAAAGIIGADVGLVMLVGLIIGALALVLAVILCKKLGERYYIDPNPDIDEAEIQEKIKQAPSALKSFLPILVPIVLIVGKSLLEFNLPEGQEGAAWVRLMLFIGEPVVALLIGMLISFLLPKKFDRKLLSTSGWVGKAMGDASNIILITGAGGIFGTILQNSGIAGTLADSLSTANLGIWLPFLLCAAIKTAQGSSTVALITTASIIAPMLGSLGFETAIDKALVVSAIGAGAMVVSHANDSGFWILTQFSGIDVKTGYRVYTFGTLVVGTFAALLVFAASFIL
ncbi:GntP family permease [Robiginitalea biformata]|uniref:GntP family permease n=1 Tax=Robiginitalea biformata (strain ATCC BAA-864 / DSM 15991 / KCTC 12146 / HTCC2501) TaxID=313596 RepID=A4CPX6_ROBBH|nr:gluconate:H+ symporter [Robiginitalea biformata]EAR14061.1 GntP family permease [Robiginitalea biformata HTCC2501]